MNVENIVGLLVYLHSTPFFLKIGAMFIQETINEFGTDHIYNADTFNEMRPALNTTEYISNAGDAVYKGMVAGDSQAVWLMMSKREEREADSVPKF